MHPHHGGDNPIAVTATCRAVVAGVATAIVSVATDALGSFLPNEDVL